MSLEKNVKEIVNTTLGAYVGVRETVTGTQQQAAEFVSDTQDNLKKALSDLQLKGQTDNSEVVVKVRETVKDLLKQLSEYQTAVSESIEEGYAKVRVELAKLNINLPALGDIRPKSKAV